MSSWQGVLNHAFLEGIARRPATQPVVSVLRSLRTAEVRLRGRPLLVHPAIRDADTGAGSLLAWGNRALGDPELRPLVELVLRASSGPWVTDLADPGTEAVDPPLPAWLEESVRIAAAVQSDAQHLGIVSMASSPGLGGADTTTFRVGVRSVPNWRTLPELEATLVQDGPSRTTREVLDDAEAQLGHQVTVLPEARRSADRWQLDCRASELHRALLGLAVYAEVLARVDSHGARVAREVAIREYHRATTIPMSAETGDVARRPNRRRQREFEAGPHGLQYFDVHAKPGQRTRIHVWVAATGEVYVGWCGEHLD